MLTRAVAVLAFLIAVSFGLSWALGGEALAALGLILVQLKIVFAKVGTISTKTIIAWVKAQGVNFARVEVAKRWVLKSLLPLIIGASLQRKIAAVFGKFLEGYKRRKEALMANYHSWPKPVQAIAIACSLLAILAMSLTTMSVWLFIFSVQLPIWILAASGSLWKMLLGVVQKLLFRTIAFMQLYKIWGFIKKRLPESYLRKKRQFDFKVARIVVRQRKMTVAQLRAQKDSLGMRVALVREYFRHKRPDADDTDSDTV